MYPFVCIGVTRFLYHPLGSLSCVGIEIGHTVMIRGKIERSRDEWVTSSQARCFAAEHHQEFHSTIFTNSHEGYVLLAHSAVVNNKTKTTWP